MTIKIVSFLLVFAMLEQFTFANDFICRLEDGDGNLYEIGATLKQKNACPNCDCTQVPVECLWGPDSKGHFERQTNALLSTAKNCDRSACVCSIHDEFLMIAVERLDSAVNKVEQARIEAKKEQDIFLGITIDEISQTVIETEVVVT